MSYETPELLRSCLISIRECGSSVLADIVVVDNSISDTSAKMVRSCFPEMRLICPSNAGYGSGANTGAAACGAEHILMLNADTRLTGGAVERLLAALDDHPKSAVVAPTLVDPEGNVRASCAQFPRPATVVIQETGLWKVFARTKFVGNFAPFFRPAGETDVPWVLGAAMCVRREAFDDIGHFDPAYFMYFEEVDLCRRLGERGWSIRFVPDAVVVHVGGASTSAVADVMCRTMYRSLSVYTRKHTPSAMTRLRFGVVVIALAEVLRASGAALVHWHPRSAVLSIKLWGRIIGDAARGWD